MRSTSEKPRAALTHSILLTLVVLLSACAGGMPQQAAVTDPMRPLAEEYVHLGLLMQNHDKLEYMYSGLQEWRTAAQGNQVPLPRIQADLSSLHDRIAALPVPADTMELQRRKVLLGRISAGIVRADILQGKLPASFDEETRLLFGVEVPHYDEAHFRELAAELDALIPGEGELPDRLQQFRDQFVIPVDKVEPAIRAALKECRQRTLAHLTLPENESVSLNITTGKHWVGFAEFKGNSQTTIHINKSVPIHVERVLQLGCHEGYPGHHVHATLMEAELVKKRDWIENTFVPLHGTIATVAEGAANYGVDLACRRIIQKAFEKSVILPLAGLNGDQLDLYYRYFDLLDELNYARNEVARHYLYGGMPKEEAIQWLMEFGLESRGTASQRLDFIDALRTYVINYNYGKSVVRGFVESEGGADTDAKWAAFEEVLSTPITAQDMLRRTANNHQ